MTRILEQERAGEALKHPDPHLSWLYVMLSWSPLNQILNPSRAGALLGLPCSAWSPVRTPMVPER